MNCPACHSPSMKVLCLAFPMRLCSDPECSCVFGFWSFICNLFPIISYDEHGEPAWKWLAYTGGYLPALWRYLRGH